MIRMLGIGIDTGGTYTDAVIFDTAAHAVLDRGKTRTTHSHLQTGITKALEQLDPKLVEQAGLIALSTTLATNAALEDIGSRAKCLMIGMNQNYLEDARKTYSAYGLNDFDQLVFMDGKPEYGYAEPKEPDWEMLKEKAAQWFIGCHSVGVTQVMSYADGGKLENRAKRVLEEMGYQVTMAHDLFNEVDVLKCGAGTLLNARLVPIISEFIASVHDVLEEKHLEIPMVIVRSDGALMSEAMAKTNPVETLLSGPASSSIGGCALAQEPDGIVVDMGGTTTDVALVRENRPLWAEKGIRIGRWDTAVKGLYVETFLLGGDSAVRFEKEKLFLDGRRMIPLCILASQWPSVAEKLQELAENARTHTRMIHEFYALQKEPEEDGLYNEKEQRMIEALRQGPLMLQELAAALEESVYTLHTERLESEGILIRSGLTPTDMMIIKGDFEGYDPQPALYANRFLAANVAESEEEIPDAVYRLVVQKMYTGIARILLAQQHPKGSRVLEDPHVRTFIDWSFEEAYDGGKPGWVSVPITTELPLIGVGAPIHVFLPKVAGLFGTRAVIHPDAPVANAVGAIASEVITRVSKRVKAEYDKAVLIGYSVYDGDERLLFRRYAEAEKKARALAEREVTERFLKQGGGSVPEVQVTVHKIHSEVGKTSMFFESIVEAVAAQTSGSK